MFKTKSEVVQYMAHNKIDCLICGKRFKNLGLHLRLTHKVDPKDYRQEHGIPVTFGLLGSDTKAVFSENSKRSYENGSVNISTTAKKKPDFINRRPFAKYHTDTAREKWNSSIKFPDSVFYEIVDRRMKGENVEDICKDCDLPSFQLFYMRLKSDKKLNAYYKKTGA